MPTSARPTHFRPVAALLLLALGLPAADTQPKVESPAVPPVPTLPTETAAADLLKSLPPAAGLVERAGKAMWIGDDPALAYQITAIDKDGNAIVVTDIGPLTVARKLLVDNRTDAIAALPALIAHAKGAQITSAGLLLREGILTGLHLFSAQTLVLTEGVLKRQDLAAKPEQRAGDQTKVAEAATIIEKALAT